MGTEFEKMIIKSLSDTFEKNKNWHSAILMAENEQDLRNSRMLLCAAWHSTESL